MLFLLGSVVFVLGVSPVVGLFNELEAYGSSREKWWKNVCFEEGSSGWCGCAEGEIFGGFYRTTQDEKSHNLEAGLCVSPLAANSADNAQECYDHSIYDDFGETAGTFKCNDGYFVREMYKTANYDTIRAWETLRCCKYTNLDVGPVSETDWNTAPNNFNAQGWSNAGTAKYIAGFRVSGCSELYCIEGVKVMSVGYSETCLMTAIEIDDSPEPAYINKVADFYTPLVFYNYGSSGDATTTTMGSSKCLTKESRFQYTGGFKLGLSFTYSASASVDVGIASAETSFELGLSAETTQEWQEETTNTETVCQDIPAQDYPCPARTKCSRHFAVYEAPNTPVPVTATISCTKSGVHTETGTFTATGGSQIEVTDHQLPLDCVYYTDDYYDRGEGKLPFCDTCSTNDNCEICRDYYVLMHASVSSSGVGSQGTCVHQETCESSCGGTIPQITQWDRDVPYSGAYCEGEDPTLAACADALKFESVFVLPVDTVGSNWNWIWNWNRNQPGHKYRLALTGTQWGALVGGIFLVAWVLFLACSWLRRRGKKAAGVEFLPLETGNDANGDGGNSEDEDEDEDEDEQELI